MAQSLSNGGELAPVFSVRVAVISALLFVRHAQAAQF
jgi:hypothetical protein